VGPKGEGRKERLVRVVHDRGKPGELEKRAGGGNGEDTGPKKGKALARRTPRATTLLWKAKKKSGPGGDKKRANLAGYIRIDWPPWPGGGET